MQKTFSHNPSLPQQYMFSSPHDDSQNVPEIQITIFQPSPHPLKADYSWVQLDRQSFWGQLLY